MQLLYFIISFFNVSVISIVMYILKTWSMLNFFLENLYPYDTVSWKPINYGISQKIDIQVTL